ncbi:MAG TPA: hypothetical protein VMB84_06350 [Stellaceae bacterium]|nr:hypothetical protein [Stellaceae bacterium]
MPYPEGRPEGRKDKPQAQSKSARATWTMRVDRAANDLNPMLVVVAIGLMVLNITLYIGMAASRQPAGAMRQGLVTSSYSDPFSGR